MSESIEPPAQDQRWDIPVEYAEGDFDRGFWLPYARDVCGLDEDILDDRPTEWIVGRVGEEPRRHYRGGETDD